MRAALTLSLLCACSAQIKSIVPHCGPGGICSAGSSCDPGTNLCVIDTGSPCNEPGLTLTCSRAVGTCTAGKRTCKGGAWSECSGVMPTAELCNGLDDDCDGKVDNGILGLGDACSVGAGSCKADGINVCGANGMSCNATPGQPHTEICNGVDDDCDGVIDNNVIDAPACPFQLGVCANSHERCQGGTFVQCDPSDYGSFYDPATPETRCDDRDNNCDGQIDEGYVLQPGDVIVSELVPCPAQRWCDAPISECGLAALPPGGNGVAFDIWPGTDALANPAANAWIELQNNLQCKVSLNALTFDVGGPFIPGLARDSAGGICANIPGSGFCVLQAPASFVGTDGVKFDRTVTIKSGATTIDTATLSLGEGCNASCRLSNRNSLAGCCDGEGYARDGMRFDAQPATPLLPNSVLQSFPFPGVGSVGFSEVLALDSGMADVNGDSVLGPEDGFIEVAAVSPVGLGKATLSVDSGSGATVTHTFSCWAPLSPGEHLAIFGGGSALPSNAIIASTGPATFDLPRDTAMQITLSDGGLTLASASFSNSAFANGDTGSRESQQLCGGGYATSCQCACSGKIASCVTDCDDNCVSVPNAEQAPSCYSPGE